MTITADNTLTPQQLQSIWRNDPVAFSLDLFDTRLWSKQEEIMLSVRDNPRTAVKSCNSGGKSRVAAEIVLWFLLSHYPSKVITTAPTFLQVEKILWKEIASLFHKSKVPIGGDLLSTELKMNNEWFALGISTDEVNRFQGFHSPYILIVLDEAKGIDPMIWEAIEGLHPYRILAIGNPLSPEGEFFKCFSSPLWHKISISAQECVDWQNTNGIIPGLVSQQWINERKEEWGVKSPLYQARVLGEFPQEGTDTLIHLDWVDRCRKNVIEEDEFNEDNIKITSADISRYGEDKTVLFDRYGHTFNDPVVKEKIPTTMTAGIIKQHYEAEQSDAIVVDDSGVGGGVTDRLIEQHIGVYDFNGGCKHKAIDSNRFTNLRSQFYWITAKKFEKGLYSLNKLSPHHYEMLKSELCSIKYKIESDGRIKVESKDDMKARGLHSPNYADALVMSEYAFFMGRMSDIGAYQFR